MRANGDDRSEARQRIARAKVDLDLAGLDLSEASELFGEIARLEDLRGLNLEGTGLREFPHEILALTSLRSLSLKANSLNSVPQGLGSLDKLVHLDLRENQISALPEDIGRLRELRKLLLSDNQLTELPASIGSLEALEELELDKNRLRSLPESLGTLSSLWVFSARHNRLNHLPASFRQLTQLQSLRLHENLLDIPKEVLDRSPDSVIEYALRTQDESRPLNEAKVVFVGFAGVGKTSLIRRLVSGQFDSSDEITRGVEVTEWVCELEGDDVRLHVWDFGGQEIMHATHELFLTERAVYVVVLEARGGREQLDAVYWLNLLENLAGDSPVIVVLNTSRRSRGELDRRALQSRFPSVQDIVETDRSDGFGTEELRGHILRGVGSLASVRARFPASWGRTKDVLSELGQEFIDLERYREIAESCGQTTPDEQDSLAAYLHDLGSVLHFGDDPRLRDFMVLNPAWATNAFSDILSSESLRASSGAFRRSQLGKILDRKRYPRRVHKFLADLMVRFELCFEVQDRPRGEFLIPGLLPAERPRSSLEFDEDDCLGVVMRYEFLPRALIARFLARTHAWEGVHRWRTGVIFERGDNRALVIQDERDEVISVWVAGPRDGGRGLLSRIRGEFDRVHAAYARLRVDYLIPVPGDSNALIPQEVLTRKLERGELEQQSHVTGEVFDVRDLLGTADEEPAGAAGELIRIFISYSHVDRPYAERLRDFLLPAIEADAVEVVGDLALEPGDHWPSQLDAMLHGADIFVMLVSPDFLSSKFTAEELRVSIERSKSDATRIVPILVRESDWESSPIAEIQFTPRSMVPIASASDLVEVWTDVIRELVVLAVANLGGWGSSHAERLSARAAKRIRAALAPSDQEFEELSIVDLATIAFNIVARERRGADELLRIDAARVRSMLEGVGVSPNDREAIADLATPRTGLEPNPLWLSWLEATRAER